MNSSPAVEFLHSPLPLSSGSILFLVLHLWPLLFVSWALVSVRLCTCFHFLSLRLWSSVLEHVCLTHVLFCPLLCLHICLLMSFLCFQQLFFFWTQSFCFQSLLVSLAHFLNILGAWSWGLCAELFFCNICSGVKKLLSWCLKQKLRNYFTCPTSQRFVSHPESLAPELTWLTDGRVAGGLWLD